MGSRILIADDDRELCKLLADFLRLDGFEVAAAHDGCDALRRCRRGDACDALVLDVMLPRMQGFDVLRELREFSALPVIMLTARGEDTDRIVGLEMGADDYLPKPCNPRELGARLRAVLRRAEPRAAGGDSALAVDSIELDRARRSVSVAGQAVRLTDAEFNVLELLLERAGQVVPRELLSRRALGRPLLAHDRSVDVHVSKLRKKLVAAAPGGRIANIRGVGYQLLRRTGGEQPS